MQSQHKHQSYVSFLNVPGRQKVSMVIFQKWDEIGDFYGALSERMTRDKSTGKT